MNLTGILCVMVQQRALRTILGLCIRRAVNESYISRGLWPPRSLSLNPCDFYVLGTLKKKEYVKNQHCLKELKENIRHEISVVSVQQHRSVARNIVLRCEACFEAEGCRFETLV